MYQDYGQKHSESQILDQPQVRLIRQIAKFVVGLGKEMSKSDVEEGMRVGVERKNVISLD